MSVSQQNGDQVLWPTNKPSSVAKKETKKPKSEKPKKKFTYDNERVFQTALRYYNSRWQKQAKKNKKQPDPSKQEIYVEKIGMNITQSSGIDCKRCSDNLTGMKYFVNKNKPEDALCQGCLGRKLKKEVGTDEERILEEMKWLQEKDLLPEHMVNPKNQWTFE